MFGDLLTAGFDLLRGLRRNAMSRDVIAYSLSKIMPGLAGLLSVLLFVRAVGLDEYGKFAFWFAVVSMAGSLCGGWLNQAQLRFASLDDPHREVSTIAVVAGAIISILALECCIFFTRWLKFGTVGLDSALVAYGLAGAAMVVHAVRVTALQARLQSRSVLTVEFLRGLMSLAIPLLLIYWFGQTHLELLTGLAIAYFVALGPFWIVRKHKSNINRQSFAMARKCLFKFWSFGWKLSIWAGILSAFPVVDRLLIEHFLGFAATGQYAALYDLIIRSYSLFFFPVVYAAHPRIMVAANNGRLDESRNLIRKAIAIQFVLFAPFCLVIIFGGMALVDLALPESPDVTFGMVLLLMISGFLWQVGLLVHKPLEISGRLHLMLLALTIALILNAIIGAWGASRFGLSAFAVANVVSSMSYIFLCIGLKRFVSSGKDSRDVA